MKPQQKINLIPKGKNENWLVSWFDSEGVLGEVSEEISDKESVFMKLLELQDSGVDMNTVSVYPPKSNVTFEEFMSM
jgi:hypothetical protein